MELSEALNAIEATKAELKQEQEALRKDQEHLASQQNSIREEWRKVVKLKSRLRNALEAVTKWLENPALPAALKTSGQIFKNHAEKILRDSDDGPSGPGF